MSKDNLIFLHRILKTIGNSIIVVFIPLYILKATGDLNPAMFYLVIYSSFVMLYMFLFRKIIEKYGLVSIMLHFLPILASEAILSFAPINYYSILGCAALMAISQALYSVPLNLIFTFGDKKTNVGKFQIASNVGKLLFTLISGFILSSEIEHSFLFLSIASSLFYIGSVFPILFSYKELKDNYNRFETTPKEENIKINPWFIVFHISFGIFQPIMDNIVPLYLYINDLSFQSVTVFIVIVEMMKIIVNSIAQFLVRHKKEIWSVSIGSILFMASLIVMVLVKNSVVLYIFSCLCSVSFPLTFVVMFRKYCNHIKDTNHIFDGMMRRDYDIFSGRPALYALSFLGFSLYPTLFLGFLAVPVMLFSEIKLLKKPKPEESNQ